LNERSNSRAATGAAPLVGPRLKRISTLKLGLAISATLILALLIIETALGRWSGLVQEGPLQPFARRPEGVLRDFRIAVVHCLMVGYLPAAFLHVSRSARKTVFELQGALACTREECSELAASIRFGRGSLLIAGLIGVAIMFVVPYVVRPVPESVWNPSRWSAEVAWHRILGPIAGWWMGWLVYAVFSVSRRLSRLASRLSSVDLFDLTPLAPFTRQGLTNALLAIGFVSISSLLLIESGMGGVETGLGVLTLFVAGAALVMPVRGVRRRIRQAKDAELAWIDTDLTDHKEALRRSLEGRRVGELADLVAYRDLVLQAPDWPFTTSTYVRFALYLMIPLGSWAAGAVVEGVVGWFFF
jgi:hypothetical protein